MTGHVCIIAEAGVNHNGSLPRALEMVDAAAAAGADAIKFQTFDAAALATASAPKAAYQKRKTKKSESQLDMLKALELDVAAHRKLLARAKKRGIEFLSTPFDPASLRLLDRALGLKRLKIGSGELTNAPLLLAAARTGKPLIVSTGMGTLDEIETALGVIAFGYVGEGAPSRAAFGDAYHSGEGRSALGARVTLLHCTTAYPTPDEDVNLRAIATLTQAFALPVGLSDHSEGIEIAMASPAAGACMIEKHFTLDRSLPGPDHAASLEPDALARMIRGVRRIEAALGDGDKSPRGSERPNMEMARKSIVAARKIAKGEPLSEENLTVKRPGGGLAPIELWSLLGREAPRAFKPDEPVVVEG